MTDEVKALAALSQMIMAEESKWTLLGGTGPDEGRCVYLQPWEGANGDSIAVDTLAFVGIDKAIAERTNHDGAPVWRTSGTLPEVLDALKNLPHPLAPDAPAIVLPPGDHDLLP